MKTSSLAFALPLASCLALVAGCRESTGGTTDGGVNVVYDFSAGGGKDGPAPDFAKITIAATAHGVSTNENNQFPAGQRVSLTGLVATTPVTFFNSNKGTECTYEVFAQDPDCKAPPCGVVIELDGQPRNAMNQCDFPDKTMNQLSTVKLGDKFDLTGTVDWFENHVTGDAGLGSVTQHSVKVFMVMNHGPSGVTITPFEVADGSVFVSYFGSGWAMYESTLVKVKPAMGKLTITDVQNATPFHFHTSPGGTDWGTTFRFSYNPSNAGNGSDGGVKVSPMVGQTWTSITGVVDTVFGGAVQPVVPESFTP